MDHQIPIKDQFPSHANKNCKLCAEYGGSSNTHKTAVCKKWLPGGKSHPEWRGGKTPANINVHQGETVNQLMTQQAEFQKSIMKQISELWTKRRRRNALVGTILILIPVIWTEMLGLNATIELFARPKIGIINYRN